MTDLPTARQLLLEAARSNIERAESFERQMDHLEREMEGYHASARALRLAAAAYAEAARELPCCDLHRAEGCCDPNDCGPCCEDCPTCPTLNTTTEAGEVDDHG